MKGLMGHCLNHETTLHNIRAKARSTEDKLAEVKAWTMVQEKKLALSEQARAKLEKQTELLRQVLEDKEKEISDTKDQLRRAKEEAIREYRDFDALLVKLEGSFAKGFNNYLHKFKASFPDLDLSHVTIDVQAQTLVQSIHSERTEELFANDAPIDDPRDDGETVVESQIKPVMDTTYHSTTFNLWKRKMKTLSSSSSFFWVKM